MATITYMAASTFGYGLIVLAAAQATLDPLPDMVGVGAALMTSYQTDCMSFSSLRRPAVREVRSHCGPIAIVGFALVSAFRLLAGL